MSLYNMLMGENLYREELMGFLGLRRRDFGRFRDVYSSDDGKEIIVFTRVGGGNRPDWVPVIAAMQSRPDYLRDWDDDFDHTFCSFAFKTPAQHVERVKWISDQIDNRPPMVRFASLLKDLEDGKDNAVDIFRIDT